MPLRHRYGRSSKGILLFGLRQLKAQIIGLLIGASPKRSIPFGLLLDSLGGMPLAGMPSFCMRFFHRIDRIAFLGKAILRLFFVDEAVHNRAHDADDDRSEKRASEACDLDTATEEPRGYSRRQLEQQSVYD